MNYFLTEEEKMIQDTAREIAREKEIKRVTANLLKDNIIMKHILAKRGFTLMDSDNTWHAELDLNQIGH